MLVTMRLMAALAVVVAHAARLSAECGPSPPTCDALESATLVFYGEVTETAFSANYVAPFAQSTDGRQDVTFNVLQAFKGVEKGMFTGTFNVVSGSATFKPGTRVLVYATRRNGRWETGCSSRIRTMRLATALAWV